MVTETIFSITTLVFYPRNLGLERRNWLVL